MALVRVGAKRVAVSSASRNVAAVIAAKPSTRRRGAHLEPELDANRRIPGQLARLLDELLHHRDGNPRAGDNQRDPVEPDPGKELLRIRTAAPRAGGEVGEVQRVHSGQREHARGLK